MKNIKAIIADITTLDTDIIVNAANKSLLGGGGVDGQIHRVAGKDLLKECMTLGGCETGESKMTDAYLLPCKKVIHTVGPIYKKGRDNERLLSNCYISSIKLAEEYRIKNNLDRVSIAYPCISTGVYGYPKEEAAGVAINTLSNLNYNNIDVIIACYDNRSYDAYKNILK